MKTVTSPSFRNVAWILSLVGLGLMALNYFMDTTVHHERFMHFYLVSFLVVTMAGLGGLFTTMLEYAVGSVWSTPMRRVSEILMLAIPVAGILGLPILLDLGSVFHWVHPGTDKIILKKAFWLNETAFSIRYVAYFAIWSVFAFLLYSNSRKQDKSGDQALTTKNVKLSSGGLVVLFLSSSLFFTDWIMSLEPHYFSTLFALHVICQMMLFGFLFYSLFAGHLMRRGVLKTTEHHYFPLGGLIYGMMNIVAYTSLVQVWLIWYANSPEDTFYIFRRWEDMSWSNFSIFLMVGFWLIPFFAMMPRRGKAEPKRVTFWTIWILFFSVMHLVWLVVGARHGLGANDASWPLELGITDLGFLAFPMGVLMVWFATLSSKIPMTPSRDPKLERGSHWHS